MGFFSSSSNSPKPGSLADSLQPYLLRRDETAANNARQQDIILAKYKQNLRLEALTKSLLSLDNPSKQDIQYWAASTNVTPTEFKALLPIIKEFEVPKAETNQQSSRLKTLAKSLLSLKNPSKQDIQQWALKADISPSEWNSLASIIKEVETPKAKSNKKELEKAQQKQRNKTLVKSLFSLKDPSKQDIRQWALKNNVSSAEWNSLASIINTVSKNPNSSKASDEVPKWTKAITDFVKVTTRSEDKEESARKYKELVPELINRVEAKAEAENIPPGQAVYSAITEYVNEQKTKARIQALIPKNDNSWFGSGNYDTAQDTVIQLARQSVPIQTLGEELEKKGWTDNQVKEFLNTAINFKTPDEAGLDPKKLAHTSVPEGGSFIDSKGNAWERKGKFLVNKINGWKVRYGK